MSSKNRKDEIRIQIRELVSEYANLQYQPQTFAGGETVIPPSGKVIGTGELQNMVDASLDGWLTTGRFNDAFEQRLTDFLGVKHALSTNSGSSANLLALASLTSPKLGERALKPGDEVISVAAGFPTTVNPLLQYGLVPVFVDVDIPTYNIDASKIEEAITSKTRAIMLAHTLGNPFDLDTVMALADKYDLWVIEDTCDALGTTYTPTITRQKDKKTTIEAGVPRLCGTFGDIATLSFYPAHHITMGEGGAVYTDSLKLKKIIESFRDWGRDCFCAPGKDNSCGRRFCWQLGELPEGYDHKYIYSHVGYNLKISDMQAACGLAQVDRLEGFITLRKKNFAYLKEGLKPLEEFLILPEPTKNADPSWFGFPITLKDNAPISRVELLRFLDERKIGTRLLFAGNLTKQPYMSAKTYRISGELTNTDTIMNNTFWIGVQPALNEEMLDYVIQSFKKVLS
ncbi:lipopolysaccharide biosynthesis protein RfbH [Terasakiella sp. SH-1]|uniref:lipopolysaccharide biosynthesis protein RfbH n=1 Tax=Terasakiella sp. SH-1 TaxID=2560057 RepID=UPI00107483AB|nr:lipopolysaccharide biosynthesis protein RfbH [Terasakiella sp. SH-1]